MSIYKWTHLDQLDGVYEGIINKAFRKEGFGVFMDTHFNTYFGHWHNDHMHGTGLILFHNGDILYTQFHKGLPGSLRVISNRHNIFVGVFDNNRMHNVGFEYSYITAVWTMGKYNKGKIVQELGFETDGTLSRPPSFMAIDQSIYKLFEGYLIKSLFRDQELVTYIKDGRKEVFGMMIHGQQQGLGVVLQDNRMLKAGEFKNGLLINVGLSVEGPEVLVGFYQEGIKSGLFEVIECGNKTVCVYEKDLLIKRMDHRHWNALKVAIKRHREDSSSFLSSNNTLKLEKFRADSTKTPNSEVPLKSSVSFQNVPPQEKRVSRFPTYTNQKYSNCKSSSQNMSSLQFVQKNFGDIRSHLERAQMAIELFQTNDDQIATEENPLLLN